jgi:hypothetical protein
VGEHSVFFSPPAGKQLVLLVKTFSPYLTSVTHAKL